MTLQRKRSVAVDLEHDEDRRAALAKVLATAAGAFVVVSSGIAGAQTSKPAGAQARMPAKTTSPNAKTTDLIPRQYHSKLTPRARGLTRADLQALAANKLTASQKGRLKGVTFGDLKSIFDAVAASPDISAGTIVRGGGEVSGADPDGPSSCCCCSCCG